jgi:hypothetical protein
MVFLGKRDIDFVETDVTDQPDFIVVHCSVTNSGLQSNIPIHSEGVVVKVRHI